MYVCIEVGNVVAGRGLEAPTVQDFRVNFTDDLTTDPVAGSV